MFLVLPILLAVSSVATIQVPRDSGLYSLTAQGLVRIEGRSVTVERSRKKVPLKGSLPIPMAGSEAKAEILGGHAGQGLTGAPVFYYRVPAGEESTGAGDLVLVKLKSHGNRREFTIGSEGEWNASNGIPLRSQVQFNAKRMESGLFRLEPADDLDPGEYGFYLFRGRELPGFLYDFSVPGDER